MAYIDPSSWYSGQMPGVLTSAEADPNLRGLWTLMQMLPAMQSSAQQQGIGKLYTELGSLGQVLAGDTNWSKVYNQINNAYQNMLGQQGAGTAPRAPGLIEAYNQMFGGLQNLRPVTQQIAAAYPVDPTNPQDPNMQEPYQGFQWLKTLGNLGARQAPKTAADWRDWNQAYSGIASEALTQGNKGTGLGDYASQLLEWFAPSQMPKVTSPALSARNLYQGGTKWWG